MAALCLFMTVVWHEGVLLSWEESCLQSRWCLPRTLQRELVVVGMDGGLLVSKNRVLLCLLYDAGVNEKKKFLFLGSLL